MNFNKYSIKITIRVVLIFITLLAAVYFIPKPNKLITAIFFIMLAFVQVFLLIHFFNSINRDLARFIIELKEQDSSEIYFPEHLENNFKNLKYSLQQILNEIKKSRSEKVSQKHYLEYILENIGEGLISFDDDGKVEIINNSAKKLLGIQHLTSIWNLDKIQKDLSKKIALASPGSQKLIKIEIDKQEYEFLFRINEVKIEKRHLKIVTFQDLKRELEKKEIGAWKKLMRVLTHEMMNSLTPITTLSVAIRRIIKRDDRINLSKDLKIEDISDIYKNNEAIEKRSKGLLNFINQFRQVWKIPELNLEEIYVKEFLNDVKQLFLEEIKQKEIELSLSIHPEDLKVNFDKKLIEQVLINLLKNSFEAIENAEERKVSIEAIDKEAEILFMIRDAGVGIQDEIKEEVFIPFFTTKESGSGIGLSLSKEIMHKHHGEIYFESTAGKATIFYLKFIK